MSVESRRHTITFYKDKFSTEAYSSTHSSWQDVVTLLVDYGEESPCSVDGDAKCKGRECVHKWRTADGNPMAWLPAHVDGTRLNTNVKSISMLVIDLDHLTSSDKTRAQTILRPYAHIWHSTHSHRLDDQCYRVVVRLSRDVTANEFHRFYRNAIKYLDLPADPSCKNIARLYFRPSWPKGAPHDAWSAEGADLDVDEMLMRDPSPLYEARESRPLPQELDWDPDSEGVEEAINLIAELLPPQGTRHLFARALAGMLRRAGATRDVARYILESGFERGGSTNPQLHGKLVDHTWNLDESANMEGLPSAITLVGDGARDLYDLLLDLGNQAFLENFVEASPSASASRSIASPPSAANLDENTAPEAANTAPAPAAIDYTQLRELVSKLQKKKRASKEREEQIDAVLLKRLLKGERLVTSDDGVGDLETAAEGASEGLTLKEATRRLARLLAFKLPVDLAWGALEPLVLSSLRINRSTEWVDVARRMFERARRDRARETFEEEQRVFANRRAYLESIGDTSHVPGITAPASYAPGSTAPASARPVVPPPPPPLPQAPAVPPLPAPPLAASARPAPPLPPPLPSTPAPPVNANASVDLAALLSASAPDTPDDEDDAPASAQTPSNPSPPPPASAAAPSPPPPAVAPPTPPPSDDSPPGWENRLQKTNDGRVANTFANVTTILRFDPAFYRKLRWNEISKRVTVTSGPFQRAASINAESLTVAVQDLFSVKYGLALGYQDLGRRIISVARENPCDPLKEYLTGLVWDGQERITNWLIDYCGAIVDDENLEFVQKVGRRWLISLVARGLTPGCKVDNVLILEGKGGIGKSTIFEVLGGDWYCDTTITLGDKDSKMLASYYWICELGEIASFKKSGHDVLKGFFSTRVDKMRVPYGASVEEFPRRCVFVGTTNDDQYLGDDTGNRKYWTVACTYESQSTPRLRADRDQLLAEAVAAFRAGERWHFSYEEIHVTEREAEKRMIDVPVAIKVKEWWYKQAPVERPRSITTMNAYEGALDAAPHTAKMGDLRAIGHALKKMGFRRVREGSGAREWRYHATDELLREEPYKTKLTILTGGKSADDPKPTKPPAQA